MSMLEDAIIMATNAHAGATDKAGRPYILHPLRVAGALADEGIEAMVVGVLHDVIEDSTYTAEDLAFLPPRVVAAIVVLTKLPHEPATAYLTRVKADPLALVVKRADIRDNYGRLSGLTDEALHDRLRRKYEFAAGFLGMDPPRK